MCKTKRISLGITVSYKRANYPESPKETVNKRTARATSHN